MGAYRQQCVRRGDIPEAEIPRSSALPCLLIACSDAATMLTLLIVVLAAIAVAVLWAKSRGKDAGGGHAAALAPEVR